LRRTWLGAALIAAMPAASIAQSTTTSPPAMAPSDLPPPPVAVNFSAIKTRYAHAKWTYPTAEQSKAAYPARANDAEMEGTVQIISVMNTDGHLKRCGVETESPTGYGFGQATVDLFLKTTHVDTATVEGGVLPSDVQEFTYKWQIG